MGTHCNQTARSLLSEMEVCMLAEDEHNDWVQYNQVIGVISACILKENPLIFFISRVTWEESLYVGKNEAGTSSRLA